jgi:hypothetical protein
VSLIALTLPQGYSAVSMSRLDWERKVQRPSWPTLQVRGHRTVQCERHAVARSRASRGSGGRGSISSLTGDSKLVVCFESGALQSGS